MLKRGHQLLVKVPSGGRPGTHALAGDSPLANGWSSSHLRLTDRSSVLKRPIRSLVLNFLWMRQPVRPGVSDTVNVPTIPRLAGARTMGAGSPALSPTYHNIARAMVRVATDRRQ